MAQMVYKGVIYNTPDTPAPQPQSQPKYQSYLGAQLGLPGAIQPPTPPAGAAPSTPSVPASNVPAPRTSGNAFTDLSSAFGNAINSAKTVQSAFNGGGGVNNAAFQALPANERLLAFKDLPQQAAQQEITRDKSVYGTASSAGDTAGATAAHNWADQVRGVAGIPNTDPTYGNVPTPPQNNQGSPQNAGGPGTGQSAPSTMPPPSSVPTPPSNNIYTPMTQDQLKADAQARVDKQLAGLRQAVDYAKTGLKSNFDYTNQVTNDRRVLENNAFGRQNNPFNGRTGYLAENMLRDRGIQDKAANDNYNNAVAAQDQKVSDFQAMAPEQQQALYDQLISAERNFGLQEGTLTGSFNGAPTLAAQGQAAQYTGVYNGAPTIQKQAQDAQYTGTYGGQPTLQAQGQAFNQNLQTNQFNAQQQNQGFNQNMQTQQFAYTQARDAIKDQQYQQTFDNNVKQQGLDYALKQATLASQITNDEAQRAIGYMNAQTSAASQQSEATYRIAEGNRADALAAKAKNTPPSKNDIDSTYVSNISAMTPENRDTFFKTEKANIIKDLGLSGYNQLYNMYYDSDGNPKG